jgi:hypothetical protein
MMTRASACQILGLPNDHTFVDVKRAYRMAAQRWHPDRSGDQATAGQFIAANEAYERLTRYRDLADRPATTATQPSSPPPPPRPCSTRRKKYEPWRYVVGTSTRRRRIGHWTVICRTVIDRSETSTTVVRSIRRLNDPEVPRNEVHHCELAAAIPRDGFSICADLAASSPSSSRPEC